MPLYPVNVTNELRRVTNSSVAAAPILSTSEATVGGVRCVDLVYTAFSPTIANVIYSVPAGSIRINTADVAAPTSYYVYVIVVNNQAVVTCSPTDPTTVDGLVFARLSVMRLMSVGGTATIYYVQRTYAADEKVLFNIRNWDTQATPVYYDGGGVTVDATSGRVSMEQLIYRRLFFQGTMNAVTGGTMILSDEVTSYADLEDAITYNDGSPITVGKYHKVLLGAVLSPVRAYPFVLRRQGVPGTEYATLDEAIIDAERVAAVGFPSAYRGMVMPLAYIAMKVGDASDLQIVDLRLTGLTGSGGGGGGGGNDHSLLINLGADDHSQYFRTDGTRVLTGDFNAGGNDITNVGDIDGVDVSVLDAAYIAHVANANAHHNTITLDANADTILSLSTQQIGLDTQAANLVFAGPGSGAAAVPTMRALVAADIATALGRSYASIYVTGGAVLQAITVATSKLTAFAVNGPSLTDTPDHTNDQITVGSTAVYRVTGYFVFSTSSTNRDVIFTAAVGGVASVIVTRTRAATSGVQYSCSFNGLLSLTSGNVVTVLVNADGNTNLTVTQAHLVTERV